MAHFPQGWLMLRQTLVSAAIRRPTQRRWGYKYSTTLGSLSLRERWLAEQDGEGNEPTTPQYFGRFMNRPYVG